MVCRNECYGGGNKVGERDVSTWGGSHCWGRRQSTPVLLRRGMDRPSTHMHLLHDCFFLTVQCTGISFLWPNNVGTSALCCPRLQEVEMEGLVRRLQSLLTIQPFPIPGFQFLGYWLAGILSCLSRDPGSFSLCPHQINMSVMKELWIKIFFSKDGGSGPAHAFLLSSFPLLGMLNKFELINSEISFPMCFQLRVGRNFRKYHFTVLQKDFLLGFCCSEE